MKRVNAQIGMKVEVKPIDEIHRYEGSIIAMTEVYCIVEDEDSQQEFVSFWDDVRVGVNAPNKRKIKN